MNNQADHSCKGLVVTDLDGTLLRSDGSFSHGDLEALESLRRRGIRTAVATGRSLYSFINSPGARLPVDYVIFTTGAGIVTQHDHKLLYRVNLTINMVTRAMGFMQDSALDFMLHRPVPDNHKFVYRRVNRGNKDFNSRISRYREFGQPLETVQLNGFEEAAQFLAIVPYNMTHDALTEVRNGLPFLSVIRATSPLDHKSTWIECFHADVSKGKTAAWLASTLDVNPVDTMAIGNDYNDQDLLEWASHAYVVENAPVDLKNRYQQVASNDNAGVAEAVNHWLDGRTL